MLADLKEKEAHKFRNLNEARKRFARAHGAVRKLFTKRQVKEAATRAGVKDQRELKGLVELLTLHPDAILNSAYWKKMGSGMASAFLYGKFDSEYKPAREGGAMSKDASSLERIGGSIGSGTYKAGRALQKAEGWFDIRDPANRRYRGHEYSAGSAFSPQRTGAIDSCISKRVGLHGGKFAYIGHEMGTAGYERCLGDTDEQRALDAQKGKAAHKEHLPAVLRELGVDPEKYMKRRGDEFAHRRKRYSKERFKLRRGR
jgi:hypothetical protein